MAAATDPAWLDGGRMLPLVEDFYTIQGEGYHSGKPAYFIRLGGRRRFLDQHLGKGSARDPRYCMRIYFCWDEDTNRVVIGHMPSHLPTSYT